MVTVNRIITMKKPHSVRDIENNEYCIVKPNEFQYLENSNLPLYDGFYGCIINDKFIPSSKREHLDPKILWVVDGREEQQFYRIANFAQKNKQTVK